MTEERFSKLYIESLFSTISRLFAFEGAALEVSILATSNACFETIGYDIGTVELITKKEFT
ncbi:hypothetical protein ASG99_12370 [Bacillus sp. Soil768D1]|nr:hypothetical protein ASG99_12370 [Bacillus sp. Soil768D1]